ncbi:MAG: DUF3500 domain-containing protein [Bacteroidota bacterium]
MRLRYLLLLIALMCAQEILSAQSFQPAYMGATMTVIDQLSPEQRKHCQFEMDAPHRTEWSRLPGKRLGLKLTAMSEGQKIAFHRMLRTFFPSQGYLKITAIMFNEDIQQKNEPVLGRNEYWLSIFGEVAEGKNWGWKLEGHHLSVNMSLRGDELIGFSPITFASNPAVAHSDGARDGLAILYHEEELARELVQSFTDQQLAEGYSDRQKPKAVYGELNKNLADIPDEGISISKLSEAQQALLQRLVSEYVHNFHSFEVPSIEEILNEKARFFFIGSTVHGSGHYYKIENGEHFIEYENYDNHIHWLWRNPKDYGKE